MKKSILITFILSLCLIACQNQPTDTNKETAEASKTNIESPIAIVIHGGAGNIKRENISAEKEVEYRAKLDEAVSKGHEILNNGGTAMEAVQRTINILEDSPLFNAGKGAVFNHEGYNELDASIMDGKTQNAGAIPASPE
jgi:beta-aspartyl-peptidase (threonine type)